MRVCRVENRELVATKTCTKEAPCCSPDPFAHLDQKIVAGIMAEGVVDFLEAIKIEKQKRTLYTALRQTDELIELHLKLRPIGQSGQWIEVRELLKLALGLEVPRYILEDADEPLAFTWKFLHFRSRPYAPSASRKCLELTLVTQRRPAPQCLPQMLRQQSLIPLHEKRQQCRKLRRPSNRKLADMEDFVGKRQRAKVVVQRPSTDGCQALDL